MISAVAIDSQIRRRFWLLMSIRCQRGIFCALAPMNDGLSNQRKLESIPSIARVAATAVNIESNVPISSMSAKPFTLGDRDREEDERGDHRHDVRVDDRPEALAVAGRDRGAHRLAERAPPP